ncbi:MAG: hypothetical protein M3405_11365 [Acidobacteriota bacterium]|jgi:hypothetical protein|nr:hypothetical protein [Acidobacteriota bacterium]
MGLDWISSTKVQNNNTFGRDNNDVKPLDVAVADGEFLGLQELTQKFVMTALGTDDPVKADEFIKQSGFDFGGKMPSRMQENGKSFYRFEPSEDFQKSIESFQKTGKAMPLGEVSNNTNGNKINANGQTQTGTPQQPTNITFEPKTPPMPPPALRREPKIYNANGGDNKFNPNDWIKVELDPKDFVTVIQKKREKPQITISGDGDPRREIYEKALYKVFGGKVDQSIRSSLR